MFVIIIKLQPASISSAICGLCIPVKDLNILNKVVVVVVVVRCHHYLQSLHIYTLKTLSRN